MEIPTRLLVFFLADQRYGLDVTTVVRVERAVEINPLPQSPDIIAGVINMRGQIIPIINVRQRFSQPQREIALSDQIIIVQTQRRTIGLMVDRVMYVSEYLCEHIAAPDDIFSPMKYVQGIVKMQDGLVLIHNLEKFLSLEEEATLTEAIEANG
jgi:purine-binding chemotaxis protein CheW